MTLAHQHWGDLRSQVTLLSILVSGETDGRLSISDPDYVGLIAAIDLIYAEYPRTLSVPEMSRRAGRSRFHFIRRFAEAYRVVHCRGC